MPLLKSTKEKYSGGGGTASKKFRDFPAAMGQYFLLTLETRYSVFYVILWGVSYVECAVPLLKSTKEKYGGGVGGGGTASKKFQYFPAAMGQNFLLTLDTHYSVFYVIL